MSDPRFPDRPDTADFRRLSDVVVRLDNWADLGRPVEELIAEVVDPESVMYLAEQRLLRLMTIHGIVPSPALRVALVAFYIDAFSVGARFQKEGGHTDG